MATIKISGMRCAHCQGAVTKALNEISGVSGVTVDLDKGEASYTANDNVSIEKLKDAIARIGFEAS